MSDLTAFNIHNHCLLNCFSALKCYTKMSVDHDRLPRAEMLFISVQKFSVKSDVWSFGILLWEVFSYGRVPYPSVSVDDVVRFLEDGNVMDPPEDCPSSIENIMLSCWHMEAEDRPTFDDLKCMLERFKADSTEELQSPALTSRTAKTRAIPSSYPIETLARSSEAVLLYNNVLRKNKNVTIYNANLLFLGPEGSGKTSLLRSFQGLPFRNVERASSAISISKLPFELSLNSWETSSKGYSVEESRLRSVVDDLVGSLKKHSSSSLTATDVTLTPPPLPSREHPRKSSTTDDINLRPSEDYPDSPQLHRRNTYSGSNRRNRPHSAAGFPVMELSVKINGESTDGINGSGPMVGSDSPSTFKRIWGSFRKNSPGKKAQAEIKSKASNEVIPTSNVPPEIVLTVNGNGTIPSQSVSPIPDSDSDTGSQNWARNPPASSLPEDAVQGIIYGLEQCKRSASLPPVCFARSVDFPGSITHSLIRPLFFTKRSLSLVAFNLSRNLASTESLTRYGSTLSILSAQTTGSQLFEVGYTPRTYLDSIMSDMLDVYLHIPSKNLEEQLANSKMLLVGTHMERCSSFMHRSKQLKSVKEAAMDLACKPMLSPQHFAVSSSSILDRSNVEELQKGIIDHMKKHMRQTVPIRWLEAASEVASLSNSREIIMPKTKFAELISRFCVSSEEVDNLIEFLYDNLFIFHLSHIHTLKDVVVTNPKWFAHHVSIIFSLTHPTNSSKMKAFKEDIKTLKFTGCLSKAVIDEVWQGVSPGDRSHLLVLMHKMDLLVCVDGQQEVKAFHNQRHSIISFDHLEITEAVVPVLVQKQAPDYLFAAPACNIEPLYFRFKGGYMPSDLFPRLLARCIRSYPSNYSLYKGIATFEVDDSVTAFVQEMEDSVRVWVQVEDFMNRSSSPNESSVSLNSSVQHNQPSADSCMALLMFLKAAISDIIHQWIPQLDFDLCIECLCGDQSGGKMHYAVLNDLEIWMGPQLLVCEEGSEITPLVGVTRWFGSSEDDVVDMAVATDELELVTDKDIEVVSKGLGPSWRDLGEILGFSAPELNIIEATSVASTGNSPSLPRLDPAKKRMSDPPPSLRRLSSSSRMMKKLRQSVLSASDILLSSDLPPGERMLTHWQHDNGNEATLSCLISALEIIQRRDIADDLIESRIDGPGFVI
jgi:energy-coupling factor transporter ATP-binding protein EcfA2